MLPWAPNRWLCQSLSQWSETGTKHHQLSHCINGPKPIAALYSEVVPLESNDKLIFHPPQEAVKRFILHEGGWDSVMGSQGFESSWIYAFPNYCLQVEVCTKYACVKSNGTQITTVEDTPSNIPTPRIHGITSRYTPFVSQPKELIVRDENQSQRYFPGTTISMNRLLEMCV